jgi:RNA recognition motif-containing protein
MVLSPKLQLQINHRKTRKLSETLTKHFSFLDWCVSVQTCVILLANQYPQHKGATENDLRREFEMYGTIERVRIVKDEKGRGRGYAFIVYERERDMKGY